MTEKERALWETISMFSFDETIEEYGFETRLADENEWTHHVTKTAIIEYKKFIFLASVSNKMVSPSKIVDIVWHQHLIFSKSYDKLCQLAGKKIEHIPSTHNPLNQSEFRTAKENTTAMYESYFGKQDPHFWDAVYFDKTQLANDPELRPRIIKMTVISVLLYIPVYYFLKPVIITTESSFFMFFSIIAALFLFFFIKIQLDQLIDDHVNQLYKEDMHTQHLNVAEVLCLKSGNNNEYIHAVVDGMIKKEKIHFKADYTLQLNEEAKPDSSCEVAVMNVFLDKGVKNYKALFSHLKHKPIFSVPELVMHSYKKNWINSPFFIRSFSMLFLLLLPIAYLFLVRLQLGLERHKPVLFLLIVIGIYGLFSSYFFRKLYRGLFDRALPDLYAEKIKSNERSELKEGSEWRYLLLGTALYTMHFNQMVNHVNRNENSSNSSGCGSSCSSSCGSSCGGGCGGCGGD